MSIFVIVVVETFIDVFLIKKSSYINAPIGLDCERKRYMLGVKANPFINIILQDPICQKYC